jgi:rhodanese-related sulfurtransferase
MASIQEQLDGVVASLGTAKFEAPTVSVAEVIRRQAAKDDSLVLLDIRTKEETDVSTIPGAISKAEYDADPARFESKEVVAFCTVGYCSGAVVCQLRRAGATNVKNMGDGALLGFTLARTAAGDSQPLVTPSGSKTNAVHTFMPSLLPLAGEGMTGVSFSDPSAVLANFNETFVKGTLGL